MIPPPQNITFSCPNAVCSYQPRRRALRPGTPRSSRAGFTLVELLAVIGIMIVMMALVGPAFNTLKGGRDITHASSDIASTLEQARAYAMANNTYVFVGIEEVDVKQSSTAKQQPGIGRIAVAVVASRDGTRIYDPNSPDIAGSWSSSYAKGAPLLAVSNVRQFDNLHLAASLPDTDTGKMARPTSSHKKYLGSTDSVTPFSWPLGTDIGSGQYTFKKVLQFDPQGSANLVSTSTGQSVVQWVELDFQQTHGSVAPAIPTNPNVGTQTAILVDGITGSVRTYTP